MIHICPVLGSKFCRSSRHLPRRSSFPSCTWERDCLRSSASSQRVLHSVIPGNSALPLPALQGWQQLQYWPRLGEDFLSTVGGPGRGVHLGLVGGRAGTGGKG